MRPGVGIYNVVVATMYYVVAQWLQPEQVADKAVFECSPLRIFFVFCFKLLHAFDPNLSILGILPSFPEYFEIRWSE